MNAFNGLHDLLASNWQRILIVITIYLSTIIFYRLVLHPLAGFPGPKLAAATRWYEAYYDMVLNGQYTFKIAEPHRKYGPIIRISPFELHVSDPTFFEKLYRQDGRWNKYEWSYSVFSVSGATLQTASHDHHRARRQPLYSYFSKAKVVARQDLIFNNAERLCDRISQIADSGSIISLGAAVSALTWDTSCEFILNKKYNIREKADFGLEMSSFQAAGGNIWRITKHIRWFGPLLMSIPPRLVEKVSDKSRGSLFHDVRKMEKDTEELLAIAAASSPNDISSRTVVHEIFESNLPPCEKSPKRIFNDVLILTNAGIDTTASVLRLVLYHLYSNPEMLLRLRAEIDSTTAMSPGNVDMKTLEQMTYLTSLILEGMRLSPAIGSRMARIAPDRDLVYGNWRIPAGTPIGAVSGPTSLQSRSWTDLKERKGMDKTYAPFSRGTRICLGMYLAWGMMYLTLAKLVQRFDVEFLDTNPTDFEMASDQFSIGIMGKCTLEARVMRRKVYGKDPAIRRLSRHSYLDEAWEVLRLGRGLDNHDLRASHDYTSLNMDS